MIPIFLSERVVCVPHGQLGGTHLGPLHLGTTKRSTDEAFTFTALTTEKKRKRLIAIALAQVQKVKALKH